MKKYELVNLTSLRFKNQYKLYEKTLFLFCLMFSFCLLGGDESMDSIDHILNKLLFGSTESSFV
jgi:hypothetical protein